MRGFAVGIIVSLAFPVVRGFTDFLVFPPGLIVIIHRDVGKNSIALNHFECVSIRVDVGAWHDTKVTGLRIYRVKSAIISEFHPCNIITYTLNLPAR